VQVRPETPRNLRANHITPPSTEMVQEMMEKYNKKQ
jgi:hypothetical protein